MPLQIAPRFLDESLSSGSRGDGKLGYFVLGTSSAVEARDALRSHAPPTYDDMPLDAVEVKRVSTEIWEGDVSYIDPERKGEREDQVKEIGDSTYTFETGGGTQHITQSLQTVDRYSRATFAPDFQGAINVTKDSVEGVDIEVPVYEWTEEHKLPVQLVTPAWRKSLSRISGMMNAAPFRTFERGEVKFKGASGNKSDRESVTVSFRFAASENATATNPILVQGIPTPIVKLGWDYLWVYYEEWVDPVAHRLIKRPHSAYVERVTRFADFSILGIGS